MLRKFKFELIIIIIILIKKNLKRFNAKRKDLIMSLSLSNWLVNGIL